MARRSPLFFMALLLTPACISKWSKTLAAGPAAYPQNRATARQRAQETQAESQKQKDENTQFLERFRTLPPEERVRVWKESNNDKYRQTIAFRVSNRIQNLLIIEGTDTVPYLAAILRNKHEPYFYRFWATRILADMDRFVPPETVPQGAHLPDAKVGPAPDINPFLAITGRRIGEQGREALLWAANEAEDQWLRFFARYDLGLVKEELASLPLDEQIRRWSDSVVRTARTVGQPENFEQETLAGLIVERAPECLPALIELLNSDKSGQVRSSVVGLIQAIDTYRFRLRKTELGRSAIDAVHKALLSGHVHLECPKCGTPADAWAQLSARFFKDDFGLYPATNTAYYAQMLHALYGEDTVRVVTVGDFKQEWAIPEFIAFITFLTDKDTFFPSWEYTYMVPVYSQAFHQKFHAKMARIEDAWKQFKADRLAASKKP